MLDDTPAERAVLGGIYKYGEDIYLDVADFLQVTTFTDPIHQCLHKCFEHLFKGGAKSIDQPSLIAAANELNLGHIFAKPTDARYVQSVLNTVPDQNNVRRWAAKIRKLEIARLLKDQLERSASSLTEITGSEPVEQIIGIAESSIFDLTSMLSGEGSEPKRLGEGIDAYLDYVESNPVDMVGISSGYGHYDRAIGGGFRRKTVSLIGARPKTGKSMLAVNIGKHVAKILGIPVLYIDTEMSKEDHMNRILPNLAYELGAKISITDVETGRYVRNAYARSKIRQAAETLKGIPFDHINVSGKSFEEIISIMRRWVQKRVGVDEFGNTKDCLIIYDYMKLMNGDGISESMKEYQLLGFMTTTLHNFAVHHDVPILSFIQLNRDGIDQESSAAFAQSDRILWLVTNYSIYKLKSDEDIADTGPQHGNRKLIVISARHGEGMDQGDYLNLFFENKYAFIGEGDTRNNIKLRQRDQRPNELMHIDDNIDLNQDEGTGEPVQGP